MLIEDANTEIDAVENTELDSGNVDSKSEKAFDLEKFDELNLKIENDGYTPTKDELDRYLKWDDDRNNNQLDIEQNKDDGVTEPDDSFEKPDESDDNLEPKDYSEEQAITIKKAMQEVGAKDVNELPNKIMELKRAMTSSGSKLGNSNKELESKLESMNNSVESQQMFIKDFIAGKQTAIDYAKENLGYKGLEAESKSTSKDDSYKDEYLDPVMGEKLEHLTKTVESMNQTKLEEIAKIKGDSDKKIAFEKSKNHYINQGASLAEQFQDYYKPKTGSVRELLNDYYNQNEGDPVDPRIQPILDTFKFASENDISNLNLAHGAKYYQKEAGKIIEAEKRGKQSLLKHKPNPSLSGKRTGGGDKVYKTISDHDIKLISEGKKDFPQEWFNNDGSFGINQAKVPRRAWKAMGLE